VPPLAEVERDNESIGKVKSLAHLLNVLVFDTLLNADLFIADSDHTHNHPHPNAVASSSTSLVSAATTATATATPAPSTKLMSLGCKKFNMDPKKGIEFLITNGLLSSPDHPHQPQDIAQVTSLTLN